MNKLLLREMSILSLILGLICGIAVMVPFAGTIVILFLLFLSSVTVYFYMKKKNALGLFEPKAAAMYGGVIGFISFLGFCATMIPIALILSIKYTSSWFTFIKQIFSFGFINGGLLLLMLVGFMAVMSGIFNAFTSMLAVFAMQAIEGTNKNNDDLKIDVEIE